MKRLLLYIFFLILPLLMVGQEMRIAKGNVTKGINIPGSKGETFAVYTPSQYSQDKKWPVIFIFDPKGRATSTANLFRPAAEDQGYIIAALELDLKSKSLDSVINTSVSMMNVVTGTLGIDPEQIYFAGMAEGAQIASALTLMNRNMAGILAINNSFVNPKFVNDQEPYMFIGIGASQDYMVYEMESYLKFYDKRDFPTEIYYFDGKENDWPSSAVIYNAVSGFTLQAVKDGTRQADKDFISKLYQQELDYVESLRRTRNYYSAYQNLERMKEKYAEFGYEDEVKDRMKEVRRTRGYSAQKRDFKQAVSYEREQQAEYEYLLTSDVMTQNFQNIGWWAYQMDGLEKLQNSSEKAKVDMAYRLKGYLDFLSKRQFDDIMKSNAGIDARIFISVLRTAINKEDPEAYFKIISLASLDGDAETALLYLEDLLKTGYDDYERLYSIDGTLDLKFSEEYNAIIQKYLKKSKY
ncbi:hypothetical protein [Christiangramia sp. OXR-203]|uniref:hypothetical protein n=1 Tax=Christiangramia sp. OXR-203 TaxID=3100176 RepID=UPI002AC99A13|nr:hypothetical protein [Christiangramia sp. OXR-203]WPY97965.1 hypothetical protein T8I65_12370 [Christiangramia sp. OXR-203]